MFNKLKMLGVAALLAVAPLTASAATLSGTIGITGNLDLGASEFSNTGQVVLLNDGFGEVTVATGDFSPVLGDLPIFTNIDFTSPGVVWEVGDFVYTVTAFTSIFDTTSPTIKGFEAIGVISSVLNAFDDTTTSLSFSTQGSTAISTFSTIAAVPIPAAGFLLFGALGGLGLAARRRQKKAA